MIAVVRGTCAALVILTLTGAGNREANIDGFLNMAQRVLWRITLKAQGSNHLYVATPHVFCGHKIPGDLYCTPMRLEKVVPVDQRTYSARWSLMSTDNCSRIENDIAKVLQNHQLLKNYIERSSLNFEALRRLTGRDEVARQKTWELMYRVENEIVDPGNSRSEQARQALSYVQSLSVDCARGVVALVFKFDF
jgi:hypothetical protein